MYKQSRPLLWDFGDFKGIIIHVFSALKDDRGVQKANKIVYTGEKKRLTGKEPSIDKICAEGNPMHLRDFEWTGFWQFVDAPQLFFDGIQGCRYEEDPID